MGKILIIKTTIMTTTKITSTEGKLAKKAWTKMSVSERYEWIKATYNFPEIDNHGTSTQDYSELPNSIKKALVTGKAVFDVE